MNSQMILSISYIISWILFLLIIFLLYKLFKFILSKIGKRK